MAGLTSVGGVVIPVMVVRSGDKNVANQIRSELGQIQQAVRDTTTSTKGAKKGFGGFTTSIIRTGKNIRWLVLDTMFLIRTVQQIGGFFLRAAQASMAFEKQLLTIQAVTGVTQNTLHDMITTLRAGTEFELGDVADAFLLVSKSGFTAAEAVEVMGAAMRLSRISMLDLQQATNTLTQVLKQFHLDADQAVDAINAMSGAADLTRSDVLSLSQSLSYVGAMAAGAGQELESTTFILAQLQEAGLAGTMAGTAMRQVLAALVDPTDRANRAMRELGISFSDAEGNVKDLSVFMQEMSFALREFTEAEQQEFLGRMFNVRSIAGVQALMNIIEDGGNQLEAFEMRANRVGESAYKASIIGESGMVGWEKATSRLRASWAAFGETVRDYFFMEVIELGISGISTILDLIGGVNSELDRLAGRELELLTLDNIREAQAVFEVTENWLNKIGDTKDIISDWSLDVTFDLLGIQNGREQLEEMEKLREAIGERMEVLADEDLVTYLQIEWEMGDMPMVEIDKHMVELSQAMYNHGEAMASSFFTELERGPELLDHIRDLHPEIADEVMKVADAYQENENHLEGINTRLENLTEEYNTLLRHAKDMTEEEKQRFFEERQLEDTVNRIAQLKLLALRYTERQVEVTSHVTEQWAVASDNIIEINRQMEQLRVRTEDFDGLGEILFGEMGLDDITPIFNAIDEGVGSIENYIDRLIRVRELEDPTGTIQYRNELQNLSTHLRSTAEDIKENEYNIFQWEQQLSDASDELNMHQQVLREYENALQDTNSAISNILKRRFVGEADFITLLEQGEHELNKQELAALGVEDAQQFINEAIEKGIDNYDDYFEQIQKINHEMDNNQFAFEAWQESIHEVIRAEVAAGMDLQKDVSDRVRQWQTQLMGITEWRGGEQEDGLSAFLDRLRLAGEVHFDGMRMQVDEFVRKQEDRDNGVNRSAQDVISSLREHYQTIDEYDTKIKDVTDEIEDLETQIQGLTSTIGEAEQENRGLLENIAALTDKTGQFGQMMEKLPEVFGTHEDSALMKAKNSLLDFARDLDAQREGEEAREEADTARPGGTTRDTVTGEIDVTVPLITPRLWGL